MPGFGLIGGGGGGGGDAPDLVITDEVAFGDTPALTIALPESAYAVADTLGDLGLDLYDQFEAADNLRTVTIIGTVRDGAEVADGAQVNANLTATKDFFFNRASSGTSYVSTTPLLAKANTSVINDQKHAYIFWNLTGIDVPTPGFSSDVGIDITHNGVGDQPLFFEVYEHTSNPVGVPFPTWSNTEPPPGTLSDSGSLTVPETGQFMFLGEDGGVTNPAVTAANNQRWFYIRFLGNTNIGGDLVTFSIDSLEAASTKPNLAIGATL